METIGTVKRFRYAATGNWFKGNTHIHTTASDGGMPHDQVARLYAGAGYDFLFRTDHWVVPDVAGETDNAPLLWINGIELDGTDETGALFHVACLGNVRDITREMGFVAALEAARQQNMLLILAHPYWCGNSIDDALRHDFHGVELYNHVCHWLNGKGNSALIWDAMLARGNLTLGLAADDAHLTTRHPGWNGGWVMVNAEACTREALLDALRTGNFYSSSGPEFHAIEQSGNRVSVRTSPVRFVRLVGPAWRGEREGSYDLEAAPITETEFDIPEDWAYVRLEIEDCEGRCAWTNTLLV